MISKRITHFFVGVLVFVGLCLPCTASPYISPGVESAERDLFGRQIAQKLNAGDTDWIREHVDLHVLQANVADRLQGIDDEDSSVFLPALMKELEKLLNNNFVDSATDVQWHFIRVLQVERGDAFLLRADGDEHVLFFAFLVDRDLAGYRIVDWFNYNLNAWASVASAEYLNASIPLFGSQRFKKRSEAVALTGFIAGIKSSDDVSILRNWYAMSEELHDVHSIALMFLNHLKASESSEVQAHLQHLYEHHQKTLGHFNFFYYEFERGYYQRVIDGADALMEKVGRDSELISWRGLAQLALGQNEAGLASLSQSLRINPGDGTLLFSILEHYVDRGDYDHALMVLDALEYGFDYHFEIDSFDDIESLKAFASSERYRSWLQSDTRAQL